jgi:aminotransferase
MAALELGQEYVRAFRQEFKRRRDRVIEYLDRLSHVFDYQKPSGSYFVFPRVKDTVPWARDSRRLAYDILQQAKVALVPGVAFGPPGEAHLRINFGREVAEIDVAFARLEGYFNRSASPATREVPAYSGTGRPAKQLLRRLAVAYLSTLSSLFLRRKRPRVIAIVGSRGKTVMKRLLGELFTERYRVRTNPRSSNTEIGLPLAVLDLEIDTRSIGKILLALVQATWRALFSREWVEVLVLEFGVRQRGDMHQLLKAVRPDVAILTNLMPQYTSDLAFLRTLQEEVRVLCQEVGQRCQFIVDGDDPLLQEAVSDLPAAPITWHRNQVRQHDHGLLFQSNGHPYHITREVVGESERISIQVAILLAERWKGFSQEGIERFLTRT